MMLDKHDVMHSLLDGEGGRGLGLGLQVAGGAHDLGQAVVQAVQVALEVALGIIGEEVSAPLLGLGNQGSGPSSVLANRMAETLTIGASHTFIVLR